MNNNKIEMFTKKCAICEEEFRTKHITKAYCHKCDSKYQAKYREVKKSNYIYMFLPVEVRYIGEILDIGSTTNIKRRISAHLTLQTKTSRVIAETKRQYNIVCTEIDGKLLNNRDELYFIEYYLIHKYYSMFGVNPIGNDRDTFQCDICTSRQFELILIAEQLKYEPYDIFRHKKILL